MSSYRWAIELARNSTHVDVVPGSSHHIISEMTAGLKTAHEGSSAIGATLRPHLNELNKVIEQVNSQDFQSLEKLLQAALAAEPIVAPASFQNISRLESRESDSLGTSTAVSVNENSKNRTLREDELNNMPRTDIIPEPAVHASPQNPPHASPALSIPQSPTLKPPNGNSLADEFLTGLSPVQISRQGPTTSPDTHISFIPVAEDYGDNEVENSFEAISTAIRKSFAGKLSIAAPVERPLKKEDKQSTLTSENRAEEASTAEKSDQTQKEKTQGSRHTLAGSVRSKSFIGSNRASLFVSLPPREPISFARRLVKLEKKGEISKVTRPQAATSLVKTEEPDANLTRSTQRGGKHRPITPSTKPSVKHPGSHVGKIKTLNRPLKVLRRTTESGSPSREDPTVELRLIVTPKPTQWSSSKPKSSVPNSRSPTKYSHLTDNSAKASPTEYGISPEPRRIKTENYPGETQAERFRNKFLSTKLDPEKPPLFVLAPGRQRSRSPAKITSAKPRAAHDERLAAFKRAATGYSVDSSRPAQKIGINLGLKLDLRAPRNAFGDRSKSPGSNKKEQDLRRESPKKPDDSRVLKKSKTDLRDVNVAPRKPLTGNAVPLPAAARGNFSRRKTEQTRRTVDMKPPRRETAGDSVAYNRKTSPGLVVEDLPDIPSDDDVWKKKNYYSSWAETPKLLRTMVEHRNMDPAEIFGDVPALNMDEVFKSHTAKE